MPNINRGGQVLLTAAVKETVSQNRLTEAVNLKVTASVNTTIFRETVIRRKPASVKQASLLKPDSAP